MIPRLFLLLVLFFGFAAPPVGAQSNGLVADSVKKARAVLVVETEHGSVMLAKSPSLVLPIASLTKLMTALVFLDSRPQWEKIVRIRSTDVHPAYRAILSAGDRISLRDLFALAMVRSDNTAASSLVAASASSSQDFVAAMNEKARSLGLLDTHFVEPTGLSAENQSTARDLVHLAAVAFANPTIDRVLQKSWVAVRVRSARAGKPQWKTVRVPSTNTILGRRVNGVEVREGKTGTTEEAGYSLIVRAQTLGAPSRSLIAVILSAENTHARFTLALDALDAGAELLRRFSQPTPRGVALESAFAP